MDATYVFEILMREHHSMLLTYLRAIAGSPDMVDDLFQETMVTAWHKLDSFDNEKPFGPWLRGIAKNHAFNAYRKHRREMLVCNEDIFNYLDTQFNHLDTKTTDLEAFGSQAQSTHAAEAWDDKVASLHHCINKLSQAHRDVIELRYLQGQKTASVGEHLNISKEALKKRLQRAKAQLLSCMKLNNVLSEVV